MQISSTLSEFAEFIKRDMKFISLKYLNAFKVDGILYGFAVTSFAWYKARLYFGIDEEEFAGSVLHGLPNFTFLVSPTVTYYEASSHLTESGVLQKIDEYEKKAIKGEFESKIPFNHKIMREMRQIEKDWNFKLDLLLLVSKDTPHFDILSENCILEHSIVDKIYIKYIVDSHCDRVINSTTLKGYLLEFKFCGVEFRIELHFLLHYTYENDIVISENMQDGSRNAKTITRFSDKFVNHQKFFILSAKDTNNFYYPIIVTKDYSELSKKLTNLFKRNIELSFTEKIFFNNFVKVYDHNRNDWKFLDCKDLDKIFDLGSVIEVDRGAYFHAAVYLGCDLIIHIHAEKGKLEGQIFQFTEFKDFLWENSSLIREYRFLFKPFDRYEIYERAMDMNKENYIYHLSNMNCEHLAFTLAIGLNTSMQMKEITKKIGAAIAWKFIGSC